jgi:hypothetical protein
LGETVNLGLRLTPTNKTTHKNVQIKSNETKFLIAMLAAAIFFAGCSKSDDNTGVELRSFWWVQPLTSEAL